MATTKSQYDAVMRMLKRDGKLTPSGILAEAKKKTSPLHSYFEWDDAKAAKEYRLWQARQLIKVVSRKIDDPAEQLAHIPARKGEGSYKRIVDVVNNIDEFEQALSEALSRLRSAERAVNALHAVAQTESPDKASMLAIAMKGLETANNALEKLH